VKLERSNAELEQFAYVASHDLQEPLRMISSYLQLLNQRYKDKLDSDADEFIDFAVDGANRMQKMINDLLTYSRVNTKAKPFVPTNCEEVMKWCLNNLQLAIEDSGVVVTNDALPVIMADDSQLTQLFQNLIGNASKFHRDDNPKIHISAKEKEDEWLFSVKDNGIGMRHEDHDRIFKIFSRLHNKTDYPGTGIGLSVCKKIVERHGGRIWVESEPGKGSTFYFTIPKKTR
ncbi:MAG: ATP-binding protein, partial [Thermoplasmata archaeon]|nr:ATP-binding protein [Thermoplasmata archaeon]